MIIRDLLQMLRRGWAIVIIMLVATVTAAVFLLSTSGVYTTRTLIAFTLPDGTDLTDDGSSEPGIITFAATVAGEVAGNVERPQYSDADARAYGIGVRQGVFVGVPDVGGQWNVVYRRAEVTVEVVGPTYEWVEKMRDSTVARVFDAADAQQEAIGIPEASHLVYTVEPLSEQIEHIVPSRSSQIIALAALAVAGAMVAVFTAAWWDRRHRRHRFTAARSHRSAEEVV